MDTVSTTVSTITRLRNARAAEAPEEAPGPVGVTLVDWALGPQEVRALAQKDWQRAWRRAAWLFGAAAGVGLLSPAPGLITAVLACGVLFAARRRYLRDSQADGGFRLGTGGVIVNGVPHRWVRWGAAARPTGSGGRWELVLDWEGPFGDRRLVVPVPPGREGQALALTRWYH